MICASKSFVDATNNQLYEKSEGIGRNCGGKPRWIFRDYDYLRIHYRLKIKRTQILRLRFPIQTVWMRFLRLQANFQSVSHTYELTFIVSTTALILAKPLSSQQVVSTRTFFQKLKTILETR